MTVNRDWRLAFRILYTNRLGIGRIKRSVNMLAVTRKTYIIPPCFGVKHDNPPYTVGCDVSPVRGGQRNIRASQGPRQAPITKARMQ